MVTPNSHYTSIACLLLVFLLGYADRVFALELRQQLPMQEVREGVFSLIEHEDVTLDSLSSLPFSRWRALASGINMGYTDKPHWFFFEVRHSEALPLQRLMEVSYPLLDHIEVYVFQGDTLTYSYESGDALPFHQRPIDHRYFLFPMVFQPDKTYRIYLRAQTSGALQVPLTFWRERDFYAQDTKKNILNAMYYGVLLVMAAFNLLLFFSLREPSYLYYVIFVSSILLLMSSIFGYGFQYLYPDWPNFHGFVILAAVPLAQASISIFTIKFLKLKENNKILSQILLSLVVLNVLCLLGALVLPYNMLTRISVVMTLPVVLVVIFAGLKYWRQGDQGAKLFSLAWLAFILGALAIALNRLGFISSSLLTEQGIPISTSAQTVLFALALASRFNSEKEARLQAQLEHGEENRKRRDVEKQLIYSASHHELTGLPNRLLFEKAIRPKILVLTKTRKSVGFVLLHVRRFDDVNKTLGHRNADTLLRRIGERINRVAKKSQGALLLEAKENHENYVAHVEGVSFCFAYSADSEYHARQEIESLVNTMSEPMEFMGLALEVSFLVGCSFADKEASDPQTLLRQAFIAFDQASHRHAGIAVYEPSMNPYSPRRLTLMTELRSAIEYDGLDLFFQPQINLTSMQVCGFEALLRWNHHEYGFVPPDEFIPMAEKTGLMKPLTRWVLKRAVHFCKVLDGIGCSAYVSVNISAMNLREEGFCEYVCELLNQEEMCASRLLLEVTETAAMIDPEGSLSVLNNLHNSNVRLAIDDFGTGHSSLSYIRKLPVHEIKIDRSFVGEMDTNKGDETIVRTTVNMCHDLGYAVVAEGVENETTMALLSQMRCDVIQGYHIAKPMSLSNTIAWLQQSSWYTSKDE